MKHAEKINRAYIRISTYIIIHFPSKVFPMPGGAWTGNFPPGPAHRQEEAAVLGPWGLRRAVEGLAASSTPFPLLGRSLLLPLLHLLLHLRHPSVLPGSGAGPVHQPGQRHSLEEDLPPPPG